MTAMQHIRTIRNGKAPGTVLGFLILLALILAPLGCDMIVSDGEAPSTPGDPPIPPPPPEPIDPPPSAALTRAPYLQGLGMTSVIIVFRTEGAVAASVDYGTGLEYGQSTTGPAATEHAIELRNLTPGERYYYRVRSGDEMLAGGATYFFDTDAGASDPEFSFFVTGDVGDPGGDQELTGNRVLQTTPRAEFGLITGDVIYPDGEASGYDPYLMQPWAPLMRNTAIWPALGNHDWNSDPEQNFVEQWVLPNNEHYYSFDRGNAHFIALDTRTGSIYDRDNQVAWLRADLQAHRDADWLFVYYHHPGYTCTYKGYEQSVIDNFHPLFEEFGVDVVFMGHAHTYERMYPLRGATPLHQDQEPHYLDPGAPIYIITGCGAKLKGTTTPDCDINAVAIDETIMFTHATVRRNVVTIRTIESDNGAVRDEITVTKTGL